MKAPAKAEINRQVYGYFLQNNTLQYIGSSHCSIESLENNHRNAHIKWPDEEHTKFRKALVNELKDGYFKTLINLKCDQPMIEHLEGMLIRSFRPPYNVDLNPVKSSTRHGRY